MNVVSIQTLGCLLHVCHFQRKIYDSTYFDHSQPEEGLLSHSRTSITHWYSRTQSTWEISGGEGRGEDLMELKE